MLKSCVYILSLTCSSILFCNNSVSKTSCNQEALYRDELFFSSTYDKIQHEIITPSAAPYVYGGINAYAIGEYILWQTSEDGLRYVMNGLPQIALPSASDNVLQQGSIRHPNFQLSSGFKAGLGGNFSYDGWDIAILYTWLYSSASDSCGPAPDNQENLAFFTGNPTVLSSGQSNSSLALEITPEFSSAEWKIHLNVVDMELGRDYFLSPKIHVRPSIGIKGSWQTQHFNISYTSTGITTPIGPHSTVYLNATEIYQPMQTQKYWGFGPRIGLDLNWMMNRFFSFVADVKVSALWSYFTTHRHDQSSVNSSSNIPLLTSHTALNTAQRIHLVNPVLETKLGFELDSWICEDHYRFSLGAYWEQQVFFNQNHFFSIFEYLSGDLMFQGLTFSLRADF